MDFNVVDNGCIRSYLGGFCEDPAAAALLTLCLERALRKGPGWLQRLDELPPDAPGWVSRKAVPAALTPG